MKIILLLSTLCTVLAKRPTCHACINSVCYGRDTILKGHKFSGQLAIDRTANTLYFHYRKNRSKDFTSAFDLDEIKLYNIPNLSFTFARAVNQETRDLFASGVHGIYRYNPVDNSTELYGLKDKTIWHMQYEGKLYYTEFKRKGLYTYVNKKTAEIAELSKYHIDDFIIDKMGDIYFMSNYAIYVLKNGAKKVELFEDEIYSLAIDKNGIAYFIQPYTRGIYRLNYYNRKLTEIGAFKRGSAFKLVFDEDNYLLYYDGNNSLYYLTPTLSKCTVTTRGVGKNRKKFIAMNLP